MTIKKAIGSIHLWLGATSGLIVFIVAITGCIYVFEKELRYFTEPFQRVEIQNKSFLSPSKLKMIAEKQLNGKKAVQIEYPAPDKAAIVAQYDQQGYWLVYLNPYTGEMLKTKNMNRDFFRIIIAGHYGLWIPLVGQKIVAWSTLIFVVLIITGLVMWWPRHWNNTSLNSSFKLKWKAGYQKLNLDLHNVLGFYAALVSLVIALTGLVWGFDWFSNGTYWITSGGKMPPGYEQPLSDATSISAIQAVPPIDRIWNIIQTANNKNNQSLTITFPSEKKQALAVTFNPLPGTYYKSETRYFDQFSGIELPSQTLRGFPYQNASVANKLRRMNYDIHTGAILGLPGKILAFFASLIVATLPITGYYIYWKKRQKRKPNSTML